MACCCWSHDFCHRNLCMAAEAGGVDFSCFCTSEWDYVVYGNFTEVDLAFLSVLTGCQYLKSASRLVFVRSKGSC